MQGLTTFATQAFAPLARKIERRARRRRALWSTLAALTLTTGSGLVTVSVAPGVAGATSGTGTGVSYTLQGCRGSTSSSDYVAGANASYFPAGSTTGTFLCSNNGDYTTGNLGGGWNELDLVPGRVTVGAGNSAPSSQTFQFAVAVDNCSGSDGATGCTGSGDHPGYDQLSALTLNTALDTGHSNAAACGTISIVKRGFAPPDFSAVGGTGTSLYEILQIAGQQANTTCDYDFDARLAFNSHLYPGSSLHYDLANAGLTTSGIGAKDVSIPVKQIAAPIFTKSQQSSRGSTAAWSVDKQVDHENLSFSNTCDATASKSATLQITVNWHKVVTSGGVVVQATIDLTNNAHRTIDVAVSDQLYDGNTQASPDGGAKTTSLALTAGEVTSTTDTWNPPANVASSYNDVATATYTDPLFPAVILGTLTATAQSTVVVNAPSTGATATIQDVETLSEGSEVSPDDYTFSVDSKTSGTFEGGYTLGTKTNGSVTWDSGTLTTSGSVVFDKTIYVNGPTEDTATLGDTATISPDGQGSTQASASTTITSGAQVSIVVSKTLTLPLTADKTFTFNATGADSSTGSTTVTVPAGTTGPDSGTIGGLNPGVTYSVDEPALAPFPEQTFTNVGPVVLPHCMLILAVVNTPEPATARVEKTTNPTGNTTWQFTLTGVESNGTTPVSDLGLSGSDTSETVTATAGAGYAPFVSNLDQDGATYTITETEQTNWDLTSVSGDVASDPSRVTTDLNTATCTFTLNLTSDGGHIFECSFTNTERSDVTVVKTENGGVPTNGYQFCLTGGPDSIDSCLTTDATNQGTLDFGYQKPGSYTLCEENVPAGTHSTLQDSPYNGTLDASGNVCYSFTLAAGSNKTFTIDNSFPQGNALTIGYWKHWNSATLYGNTGAPECTPNQTGNVLADCFLPKALGTYTVNTAQQVVAVLSNASCKYAENCVAAQLLAAELNVSAGALTCSAITSAIGQANTLLSGIGYAGPPSTKIGPKNGQRSAFVSVASALNSYNNNTLC